MAESSTGMSSSCQSKTDIKAGRKSPVCLLVLGMAGSGKTSFVQCLSCHLHRKQKPHHIINLDPAVKDVPFLPYIDIRDTVNYKQVMKQYGLGPNGGIVTSLNLFSTMFDDVMKLMEKKANELEYVIFDTPGQIEVFNWSASGPIIAGSLASVYPTIIIYVFDTPRSVNPQTFMSNMLYSCSILYKYKLPFIIAMNKIDILDCKYALTWISDFEEFQNALANETSYASNLTRSLSLAIEEFYKNIKSCGVSSTTGQGLDEFLEKVREASIEFEEYRTEYEKMKQIQVTGRSRTEISKKKERDLKEDNLGLISVKRAIRQETEVFLSPTGDSSSDDERLDVDDFEEKNDSASFVNFIKQHSSIHSTKVKEQEMTPSQSEK